MLKDSATFGADALKKNLTLAQMKEKKILIPGKNTPAISFLKTHSSRHFSTH